MRVPPVQTGTSTDRTGDSARQATPRRLLLGLLLVLAVPWPQAWALDPSQLVIETSSGAHRFTIELATTPAERERGLMFRRAMQADHGMLFDFQEPQPVAFWMKNTPLPLDMLFIDERGTVVQIEADTVPFSETPVPSNQPIRAVLEVNAGVAKRLGITPGAKVIHPAFADPS